MDIFLQIFAFIFAIFLLVTIHEWGHFWVAKKFGIKVLRFSIGFGKPMWKKIGKDGTEYVVAPFLLGGYVRLLDEREEQNILPEDLPYAFNRKPLWVRFCVILAGPLTNWILGFILFWCVFAIGFNDIKPIIGKITPQSIAAVGGLRSGDQIISINNQLTPTWQKVLIALLFHLGNKKALDVKVQAKDQSQSTHTLQLGNWKLRGLTPKPLENLGIFPYVPNELPIIFKVLPDSPAAQAGLISGDHVLAINNLEISDWEQFVTYVMDHPQQNVTLSILRNNQKKYLPLTIGQKRSLNIKKYGFIGVQAKPIDIPSDMKIRIEYPIYKAWLPAIQETLDMSTFNFFIFGKMLTGGVSLQGLGGPITIFRTANQALKEGIVTYLNFLAILSIMLAAINIVPIPGLDGGHLLFIVIEAIRGKPLSFASQAIAWRLGMVFLIALMLQATINDVLRLL